MASLNELDARVAALEASRADHQAVLAAVNTVGANQRAHTLRMDTLATKAELETQIGDLREETRASHRGVLSRR